MKIPSDFQQPSPFSPMNLCHMMASIMLKTYPYPTPLLFPVQNKSLGTIFLSSHAKFLKNAESVLYFFIRDKKTTTHSAKGPWNKSLNLIFPTKYVIPKSLSRFALGWVDDNPKIPGLPQSGAFAALTFGLFLWSLGTTLSLGRFLFTSVGPYTLPKTNGG